MSHNEYYPEIMREHEKMMYKAIQEKIGERLSTLLKWEKSLEEEIKKYQSKVVEKERYEELVQETINAKKILFHAASDMFNKAFDEIAQDETIS